MMIIEINRSNKSDQRTLYSDECMKIVGIRQEAFRARQILYVHTALRWEGEEEGLPDEPPQITEHLDKAIKALRDAGEFIRRHVKLEPSTLLGARTLQLGALHNAVERLKAIQAPEMQMKAGKWNAVNEAKAKRTRIKRSVTPEQHPPGYILAMRVLQSDLYAQLDDIERAECDALVAAGHQAMQERAAEARRRDEAQRKEVPA